jgi:hypothetical protein
MALGSEPDNVTTVRYKTVRGRLSLNVRTPLAEAPPLGASCCRLGRLGILKFSAGINGCVFGKWPRTNRAAEIAIAIPAPGFRYDRLLLWLEVRELVLPAGRREPPP